MDDFLSKELVQLQIKSLAVFEFLNLFNQFETKIRDLFEKNIEELDTIIIQKLYFYYGGKIGTFIDYPNDTMKLNVIDFKKNEKFRELTINQIVRILKQESSINFLKYKVDSLQYKTTYYEYMDCIIKLINMRNKLSHELSDLNFHEKDLIEMLSLDKLREYEFKTLQNYDLSLMDDMTKYIASNIVYMKIMLSKISQ
jgi:hypothetical protein